MSQRDAAAAALTRLAVGALISKDAAKSFENHLKEVRGGGEADRSRGDLERSLLG